MNCQIERSCYRCTNQDHDRPPWRRFAPRRVRPVGLLIGLIAVAMAAPGAWAQCTIPPGMSVVQVRQNENVTGPITTFVSWPANTSWIKHANLFSQPFPPAPAITITHVCVGVHPNMAGTVAVIEIWDGFPVIPSTLLHTQSFTIAPNFNGYQLVALNPPIHVASGGLWISVEYPQVSGGVLHQGVGPRTSGSAWVLPSLFNNWMDYDCHFNTHPHCVFPTMPPNYFGNAPIIRAMELSTCGPGATNCFIAANTPGCSDVPCCQAVDAVDPFCNTVAWDALCVDHALALPQCVGCGDPGNDCFVSSPTNTPYCDDGPCCVLICANDPFCCNVRWDSLCANAAQAQCAATPPNDLCINATPIGMLPEMYDPPTFFDNFGAGTDGPVHGPFTGIDDSDVWFEYVATGACEIEVKVAPVTGTAPRTRHLAVYEGGCPGAPGVALVGEDSSDVAASVTFTPTPGQTYIIRVGTPGGAAGQGDSRIKIETTCVGDFTNNCMVGVGDLLFLLSHWGPNPGLPGTCIAACNTISPSGCWCDDQCFNIFNDCCVDICDHCDHFDCPLHPCDTLTGTGSSCGVSALLELLSRWGPCP